MIVRLLVVWTLVFLLAPRSSESADYVDGDLYMLKFPYESSLAIVHINPNTGEHSTQAVLFPPPFWATMTYDAYRDVMVVSRGSNATGGLTFVDADGNRTSLPGVITPFVAASRGDGIIYLFRNNDTYKYVDAQDVEHDLLDEAGNPFSLGSLSAVWDEAFFHAPSNSLILANGDASAVESWCPNGDQTCVLRLPLDETGTRVVGPITSAQIDIVAGTEEDNVVGITPGPTGLLSIVIDTNTNNRDPRMQMLDPVTLEFSLWAENGPFTGAAATNAGVYSTPRGEVVIFDSLSDVLRSFDSGEVGGGTVIGPPLGGGFASESARLIEVRRDDTSAVAETVSATIADPVSVFPNPFQSHATVSFQSADTGAARVGIYDASGRLVRALDSPNGGTEDRTRNWDGRDESGSMVAPGIYFVRVHTGITTRSKKIIRSR